MVNTLIGIVTYGNLDFTRLAIESIKETTKDHSLDFIVVVGKPGDTKTIKYLADNNIFHIIHNSNFGFPKSINDIYDYAWKAHKYDYLIIAGNDIVVYPYAIDSLINLAEISDYDLICATEYNVKDLIKDFPRIEKYFVGPKLIFTDFSSKCWELFTDYSPEIKLGGPISADIQNLALYKKSVFDTIGYTDVAFFPCYFIDNDYAKRIQLSGLKYYSLLNARFFHFWSRTFKQESGGSTDHYFDNNKSYYIWKWGGEPDNETKTPDVNINSREKEQAIINYWRSI